MFKKILYFDKKSILDFQEMLNKRNILDVKTKASISAGFVGAEIELLKKQDYKNLDNLVLLCNSFESDLSSVSEEYYFDFLSSDYDINSIPISSIIKFESEIEIPEDFDYMDLISKMSHMIPEAIGVETSEEKELFNNFFQTKGRKLPCLIRHENLNNGVCFAKLNPSYIVGDITIEDLIDRDLKIIANISGFKKYKGTPIIVFDVFKDFFYFNRAMRRNFDKSDTEFKQELGVSENVINIEILAIYY